MMIDNIGSEEQLEAPAASTAAEEMKSISAK